MSKEEDFEELEISQKILKILEESRQKIMNDGFRDFDASYFNVDIDLKVTIDGITTRIKDKWSKLE